MRSVVAAGVRCTGSCKKDIKDKILNCLADSAHFKHNVFYLGAQETWK